MFEMLYTKRKNALDVGSLVLSVIPGASAKTLTVGAANVSFTAEYSNGTVQSFLSPTTVTVPHNLSVPAGTTSIVFKNIEKYDKLSNFVLMEIRSNTVVQGVTDWSTYPLESLRFNLNNELITVPAALPPNFKTMYLMFYYCAKFNSPNVVSWNTSAIRSFYNAFNGSKMFNQPIGVWDTGSATEMDSMLVNCSAFNQSLSNYNTSKVTTFASMLKGCGNYNQSNALWDVSSGTNFSSMYQECLKFNQTIANWNMSKATNISDMFNYCTKYNQDLSTLVIPASASRSGYDSLTNAWPALFKPQFV